MCIYCGTKNYRKIYINHFGPIPNDYHIHHIDGNRSNNDPTNLKAVTIQEHYDIHYAQGDWTACMLLGRNNLTSSELSALNNQNNAKRIKDGTHNFLGEKNPTIKRIKDGTHHFLDSEFQRKNVMKAVKNGTHPFLGGEIQGKTSRKRISKGTHNFLRENNPGKIRCSCIWCKKETNLPSLSKHSEDKCKDARTTRSNHATSSSGSD